SKLWARSGGSVLDTAVITACCRGVSTYLAKLRRLITSGIGRLVVVLVALPQDLPERSHIALLALQSEPMKRPAHAIGQRAVQFEIDLLSAASPSMRSQAMAIVAHLRAS